MKARVFCDASQHYWSNFFTVMKRKDVIWETFPFEHLVGSRCALYRPANTINTFRALVLGH